MQRLKDHIKKSLKNQFQHNTFFADSKKSEHYFLKIQAKFMKICQVHDFLHVVNNNSHMFVCLMDRKFLLKKLHIFLS